MLRTIASAAIAVFVALLSAGCSDAAEDQAVIEGPPSTTASTDAGSGESGEASLEAPFIVDGTDYLTMAPGQSIDVVTANATKVETDDSSVLEVSQPSSDGSAEFNAGAVAVGTGAATLGVYHDDELLYEVQVTVEG